MEKGYMEMEISDPNQHIQKKYFKNTNQMENHSKISIIMFELIAIIRI